MLSSIKSNVLQSESKKLAMMYFRVAIILFGAQLLFGLLAGLQFLFPGFLYGILDFSVNRMVHINALVVWMLYAMIGSVYLMLPDETGIETVGIGLGKLAFWVLTAAVTVVVLVYLLVQVGPGKESTIWLINEGREYLEAPRWADIGIVVVVLIFYWNVFATYMKGKRTGIMTVMVANLMALAGLYLAGMFFTDNISVDQYWWWWVIHLWVEATWEVFVGTLAAYALIKVIDAKREIVEMWLWIEVLMLFGSGILGLGHHYFWIGTPEYWWEIGALFSALEPVPLVAMFVHVLYDWGKEQGHTEAKGEKSAIKNGPAMAWITTNAFGNFLGAGIWGFFHTLPQVNIYTHGSQFTAAHGHLAFFGAYATILIGMMYLGIQEAYGIKRMKATFKSKMAIFLITFGVLGMAVALTIAGYEQVLVERAELGAGWQAFFTAQNLPWYVQAQVWREIMGLVTFVGFVYLLIDLLTIGKKEAAQGA
ncbi:cbb3-type cytochrome c oxidase subunit I [Nitratifractor salsuginis]|uniref:Nitric oxide reductase, NorB subunit apoprotein n=1 Tax=Nitratifractor salsuginis (strain DSM 16511 / JCM 12458 / E9I37-1) TaxID=749222 RepID=E6X0G0_NITSE|nr:cbb3-type cytochrome c oxidase subunit I [Nitratifractor salsuginis]ADV46810.1 nitric oxide reductase, NorB subunit apoprotein [Nitratifractor salsuginis DSM 16511]